MIIDGNVFLIAAFGLLLYPTNVYSQSPSNDECGNAIIIPSDTTALPYISSLVEFKFATANINDAVTNCTNEDDPSDLISVWYKWLPSTTGIFWFSNRESDAMTAVELFRGNDCGSLVEVACALKFFEASLMASETYYIKLSSYSFDADTLQMSLFVNNTNPPPSNAVCSNATVVEVGDTVTGNLAFTKFALPIIDIECFDFIYDTATLWYKVTNNDPLPKALVASTCHNSTNIDTVITVFKGDDSCIALDSACDGGTDDPVFDIACGASAVYTFLAAPFSTYYIAIQSFDSEDNDSDDEIFTLSIELKQNYFTLINSVTDKTIDALRDIVDYTYIPSAYLNIEAVFENRSVQSVMVTFDDNPGYTTCELFLPYSVFKDVRGNFLNQSIHVGNHNVTAKTFAQTKCMGEIGSTMSQQFTVRPCTFDFIVYEVSSGDVLFEPNRFNTYVDSLPCNNVNVEVVLSCGFDIKQVEWKLRNISTATIVRSQTELLAPYYLFGNIGSKVLRGTINSGDYNIELTVNGINFRPFPIQVGENCYW